MGKFSDLCEKYGCDKESVHRYGDAYDALFRGFDAVWPLHILEIGIYKGSSLHVLKDYFPHAKIWAIDIDPAAVALAPQGVTTVCGDQCDISLLTRLAEEANGFSIIIDDGSHRIDHQQISLSALWPHVRVSGVYVIEDLETSKSSRTRKWNPRGLQSTLDMLLDKAKSNVHWGKNSSKPPIISFYREMCALTKMEK
jgi:hypothetical protein